jgi:hypothetical protein
MTTLAEEPSVRVGLVDKGLAPGRSRGRCPVVAGQGQQNEFHGVATSGYAGKDRELSQAADIEYKRLVGFEFLCAHHVVTKGIKGAFLQGMVHGIVGLAADLHVVDALPVQLQ